MEFTIAEVEEEGSQAKPQLTESSSIVDDLALAEQRKKSFVTPPKEKRNSKEEKKKPNMMRRQLTNEEILLNIATHIKKRQHKVPPSPHKLKTLNPQNVKKAFILYISGCAGSNLNMQIVKGLLRSKMSSNQYLNDYKMHQTLDDKSFLVSPELEHGVRVLYKIQELSTIEHSVNISLDSIKEVAKIIFEVYDDYDSFIVIAGEDTMCYLATYLSFMFQSLSKLIICMGGFFPITFMRTDIISNLITSFAIIATAENLCDVIIVSKNKGYRGNRSIKINQAELGSIQSPNYEPLVSVSIKIKFRQNLFIPFPGEECRLWTQLSPKVGVIRIHILLSLQSLQYELNNPAYDAFVIQGYPSNSLPDQSQMLNLFKKVAEQKGTIFVTVSQSIQKMNTLYRREYLQQFLVYNGGDTTLNGVCAKLSYLLSKGYSRPQIRKLLYTSLRGQLTPLKKGDQFEVQNISFMEMVQDSIEKFYPTKKVVQFLEQIQDSVSKFVIGQSTSKQIQQLFKKIQIQQIQQFELFHQTICNLVNRNNLLHKTVQDNNETLCKYFLQFAIDVNCLDQYRCSAMYYAVAKRDKKAVLHLGKKGGHVICPYDQLFQVIAEALTNDEIQFFELLYHTEFKDTLRELVNVEKRSSLHLAAILGASNCMKYLLQRFKFNMKLKDSYGKLYTDYLKNN